VQIKEGRSIADNPGEISMLDHTDTRVPLDRVEVSEARRSFGLIITGDRQWDDEVAQLLEAPIKWSSDIFPSLMPGSSGKYAE
jgi:hypothetical protein